MNNNFVSVRKLAEYFGCSIPTVRRWVASGDLKCTRIGQSVRFSPENIAEFLKASESKAVAQ